VPNKNKQPKQAAISAADEVTSQTAHRGAEVAKMGKC